LVVFCFDYMFCNNCLLYMLEPFLEIVLFMMFSEKWKLLFLDCYICLTYW
jgi:hypothetical protein